MTLTPQYYSPVPMPPVPSSLPDLRPKVLNEEFYNATGSGIASMGKTIGADGVIKDGLFSETMLKALDKVSSYQKYSDNLYEQAILAPDSVNIEDITMAEARANMSLNIARTILNRVVQAWKDVINTR
ncbi:MAG: flagellar hook-basal body complex protein FliE [Treponema sp.]|nr:flagellar hook-basal body complex protein FliE [Treponema sp.]